MKRKNFYLFIGGWLLVFAGNLSGQILTWEQVNTSGFGDAEDNGTCSLTAFGSYLYAGTEKGRIFRTADGTTWTQVNEDGFGDANNGSVTTMAIFGTCLYAGVDNSSTGVEIWRTQDGLNWSQCNTDGFGDASNANIFEMVAFKGYLYALVYSEEYFLALWRASNGSDWEKVSTQPSNFMLYSFCLGVFDDYLYATGLDQMGYTLGLWRSPDGTNWSSVKTFAEGEYTLPYSMCVFDNVLYVGMYCYEGGASIWRTSNGTTWTKAIPDGFGDANNTGICSLTEFGDYLYAGTMNSQAGGEVWRTADGVTWYQVNADGFWDPNNDVIFAAAVLGDYLYCGVVNGSTGVQVWRTGGQAGAAYFIKGFVRDEAKQGISEVEVVLSSGGAGIYTTAETGSYEFLGLPAGNYTVTPTKSGYSFDPPNRNYSPLNANKVNQNFTGTSSGVADTYEPNDSFAEAYGPLVSGKIYESYLWTADDVDYYKIELATQCLLEIDLTSLPKNYDLTLYNSDHSYVESSSQGGTSDEHISYAAMASGTYYIRVDGSYSSDYSDTDSYLLSFSTSPVVLYTISGYVKDDMEIGISGVSVSLHDGQYKYDYTDDTGWYEFTVPGGDDYTVRPSKSGWSFEPYSRTHPALGSDQTDQDFTGSFEDTYEPNDNFSQAYGPLESYSYYSSYIGSAADVDYYKISIPSSGTISVNLTSLPANYDLYLYNASQNQVGSSINSGSSAESINYLAPAEGTYYIKVVGVGGAYSRDDSYSLHYQFTGPEEIDTEGPITSDLMAVPNPTDGASSIKLTAYISDYDRGGSDIVAAEYFVGEAGADGTGTPMEPEYGSFGSWSSEDVIGSAPTADWALGKKKIYVHGKDEAGNWGSCASIEIEVTGKNPEWYNFVTKWGSKGTGDGQFIFPIGIAVGPDGSVYVADCGFVEEEEIACVQKFTADGEFITKWGSFGEGDGQFIVPYGICVDKNGCVYVADAWNCRVQKFSADGEFLLKWGSYGSEDGQFGSEESEEMGPTDLEVDSEGNIWVVDCGNFRIQKFDSEGNFLSKFSVGAFPFRITVDCANNIYTLAGLEEAMRIMKFNSEGDLIKTFGREGCGRKEFWWPIGITADSENNIYVADLQACRVQKINSEGNFITQWGSYGSGDGQFNSPADIAVDADGNAFVVDSENYRIQKFSREGEEIEREVYYSIKGRVKDQTHTPMANVMVVLAEKKSETRWTDASGCYEFTQLPPGNYSVKPYKAGYEFLPQKYSYRLLDGGKSNQNFTGNPLPNIYSIKGYVTDSAGGTIEGVKIVLSGPTTGEYITGGAGWYEFLALTSGNYRVTPTKVGYSFSPASRNYSALNSNQVDENYVGMKGEIAAEGNFVKAVNNLFNPYNGKVTIWYSIEQASPVNIKIYTLDGEMVTSFEKEYQGGLDTFSWDGRNEDNEVVASGVYLVHITAGNFRKTKRVIIIK